MLLLAREIMLGSRHGIRVIPPVSLVLLIVLSGVFWLRYGPTKIFFFDEYSHWGIYLKEMIARDALWDENTNAMHARYLPGPSLFQYFFSRGATTAFEGAALLAQFVLFLTPLLLLTHRLRWHQWPWIIGVLALGLLSITQFSQGLSSLYVDHVLGAWLAGSLLGICPHLRAIKWISDPACTSCHDAGPDQGRRHCLCDCGHRDHRDRDALPGPPGCARLASQHGNHRAGSPY